MGNKINIKDYFDKGIFVVPTYQRGYKWSVKSKTEKSSLEHFVQSLIIAFKDKVNEYFIESVTVVEKESKVVLVDGQQRTTSLFLLFVALADLKFVENKLIYDVRKDSHKYLNSLFEKGEDSEDNDTQDIYYFKEAQEQIKVSIAGLDKDEFSRFIKEKVFLLFNVIPEDKAVNTFIALNGLKAVMKDEELIKSDLLIKSSRVYDTNDKISVEEKHSVEWKINEDRGRLARNWDKWLYWWNQQEVRKYFGISTSQHPLYYLLITYWSINKVDGQKEKKNFTFDNFKSHFIDNTKNAKHHFEGLRKLQKTFEDIYSDWEKYNLLGLAFETSINKNNVLQFFIRNREDINSLHEFVKWALIDCHYKITSENDYYQKRQQLRSDLENKDLYISDNKRQAYIQLLRMNVLDMTNRKFDFEVFKTKSLEHICPQSPPEDNKDFRESRDEINEKSDSINSIGNLVLLNGSTNSSLSNNSYHKKKQILFDKIKQGFLLPHTLKVFSKSFEVNPNINQSKGLFDREKYWLSEDVKKNKDYFFNEFDLYYGK